jgi:hypothetical protein
VATGMEFLQQTPFLEKRFTHEEEKRDTKKG